jgi:small conductance mechanosensitive channel
METVQEIVDHPHRFEIELSKALDTAMDLMTTYGFKVIGALLILLIGYLVANWTRKLLIRAGQRSAHVDITIAAFIGSLAKYFIIAFTLIAVLGNFGVQTSSVVAVVGAAGLAIGLALQGTLAHVAAGIMLVIFRPFRVGDAVETAGISGVVREINLFSTEITGADNTRIVVPNNAIWSGVTKNLSTYRTRRLELEVPIPYGADASAALAIMKTIVEGDARVLRDPPPVVGVSKFVDANTRLVAQVWTSTADAAAAQLALNTAFREQLGRAGHLRVV